MASSEVGLWLGESVYAVIRSRESLYILPSTASHRNRVIDRTGKLIIVVFTAVDCNIDTAIQHHIQHDRITGFAQQSRYVRPHVIFQCSDMIVWITRNNAWNMRGSILLFLSVSGSLSSLVAMAEQM